MSDAALVAAHSASRLLRAVRERIELDREYVPVEVADVVAYFLDGEYLDHLSAKMTAEADGDTVTLTLHQHDSLFDRVSPIAQQFMLTVVPVLREDGPGGP